MSLSSQDYRTLCLGGPFLSLSEALTNRHPSIEGVHRPEGRGSAAQRKCEKKCYIEMPATAGCNPLGARWFSHEMASAAVCKSS